MNPAQLKRRLIHKINEQDPLTNRLIANKEKKVKAAAANRTFEMIPMYPKQLAIVTDPARFTITEASTKAGKTASHIEWLLKEAIDSGEGNWWWVAPIGSQAMMAFNRTCDRLRGYMEQHGSRVKVGEVFPFKSNKSERFVKCNGATIWFRSADNPDSLYGEDVRGAVCDEISRWKEDSWTAVYSTLTATGGKAKLIGNVKGKRNFAYKMALKAKKNIWRGWSYHRLTADDAVHGGVVKQESIDEARENLPEHVFRELYMAEAADDGSNPFGNDKIALCATDIMDERLRGDAVVFGVDLGKSIDWSVIIGLNDAGFVCSIDRFQEDWNRTVVHIRIVCENVYTLVDSTGLGDPVLDRLQEDSSMFEGFKFSASSKQKLMENLAIDVAKGDALFPEGGELHDEIKDFEYVYTRTGVRYSAPDGLHDDCVCAWALARKAYRERKDLVFW